jgi:hypothetical protein
MSVWRQKAIACLPEFKADLEQSDISIYEVFSYLLTSVRKSHQENDTERLKVLYSYAEWCFRQKQKDLWNAAGVAFYEHLGDHIETRRSMAKWVKQDIYKEIRELLKLRIDEKVLKEIDKSYSNV